MKWKILSLICLLSVAASAANTPTSVLSNSKGLEDLKNSNPSAAQEKFLKSLAINPFESKLHLNLGLTFEMLGKAEKEQASYQTALQLAAEDDSRFAANFNLGQLAQKAKKTDEALRYYQEALKFDPQSKETKTNIELLIQDQQGKGKGEGDEQKDPNENKDQDQNGKGQEQKEDPKDDQQKEDQKKDGDKKEEPKQYAKSKPQPQKFKSENLTQADVNKIMGEIKQQEQKIRAEFNKRGSKEEPRDKDW